MAGLIVKVPPPLVFLLCLCASERAMLQHRGSSGEAVFHGRAQVVRQAGLPNAYSNIEPGSLDVLRVDPLCRCEVQHVCDALVIRFTSMFRHPSRLSDEDKRQRALTFPPPQWHGDIEGKPECNCLSPHRWQDTPSNRDRDLECCSFLRRRVGVSAGGASKHWGFPGQPPTP